jgi:hypothetical protein
VIVLVIATVAVLGVTAVAVSRDIARKRAAAAAFRRLGMCEVVNSTDGTVACAGLALVSLRLPSSFAVCQSRDDSCVVTIHEHARPAFASAVAEIDERGLGRHITRFGTVNQRMCRDALTGGWREGCISRHSYGIAADIRDFADNANWDAVRQREPEVDQVIDIFRRHGFRWGGTFRSNFDPQHVEWIPR